MEWIVENPDVFAGAVVSILGAAWILFKAIAKITPNKKDDAIVEAGEELKEAIEDELSK